MTNYRQNFATEPQIRYWKFVCCDRCIFSLLLVFIHPIEKTGKSINHWRCDPMVFWKAWKPCLCLLTRAHYNNTAGRNLLFQLPLKKIFWIFRNETQEQTCPCHLPKFQCVALSIVNTFHPTTFCQTGVYVLLYLRRSCMKNVEESARRSLSPYKSNYQQHTASFSLSCIINSQLNV